MGGLRKWFKVPVELLMSTRFQRLSDEYAGRLFRLLGFVWRDSPDQFSIPYDTEDLCNLLRGISEEELERTLSKLANGDDPIILVENDRLVVPFLQEQAEDNEKAVEQRRNAARSRWGSSASDDAGDMRSASGSHTGRNAGRNAGGVRSGMRGGIRGSCGPQQNKDEKIEREREREVEMCNKGEIGGSVRGERGGDNAPVADASGSSEKNADDTLPGIPPSRSRKKFPDCPCAKIIESYRERLVPPLEDAVDEAVLRTQIRNRWRDEKDRQSLEWWDAYFDIVSGCPYLIGKVKDWRATLLWLTGKKNTAKVLAGQYVPNELKGKFTTKGLKNMNVAADIIRKLREQEEGEKTG